MLAKAERPLILADSLPVSDAGGRDDTKALA